MDLWWEPVAKEKASGSILLIWLIIIRWIFLSESSLSSKKVPVKAGDLSFSPHTLLVHFNFLQKGKGHGAPQLPKKKKHRGANSRALLDSCHQNSKQPRKIQQGIADIWEPQLDQEQPRGVITWAAQDKLRAFTTRKWKEKANTEHHMKYPYIHSYLTSENVIPAMSPSPASLDFFYL